MARIPTVREDDPAAPPEAREFLQRIKSVSGEEPFNSMRLLANHPDRANSFIGFARMARDESGVGRRLKELAWMTASEVNRCHY
jgi:hypothetical protein